MRDRKGHRRHPGAAQPAVTEGIGLPFEPVLKANTRHTSKRRCARDESCICQPATVLSIYNPGPYCYCCDVHITRAQKEATTTAESIEGHLSNEIADIESNGWDAVEDLAPEVGWEAAA